MPLLDTLMDKLEAFCQQEDIQARLRQNILEPAASHIISQISSCAAVLSLLLMLQIVLLTLLLWKLSVRSL